MTPKLLFWLYAFLLTCTIMVAATKGIASARRGAYDQHRIWMNRAGSLIVAFVLSYVLKVIFLGKEDLDTWANVYVVILRIHESFIGLMLICGGYARLLARKFQHTINDHPLNDRWQRMRRRHAILGKISVAAAAAALLTASGLIIGMLQRAGLI